MRLVLPLLALCVACNSGLASDSDVQKAVNAIETTQSGAPCLLGPLATFDLNPNGTIDTTHNCFESTDNTHIDYDTCCDTYFGESSAFAYISVEYGGIMCYCPTE